MLFADAPHAGTGSRSHSALPLAQHPIRLARDLSILMLAHPGVFSPTGS